MARMFPLPFAILIIGASCLVLLYIAKVVLSKVAIQSVEPEPKEVPVNKPRTDPERKITVHGYPDWIIHTDLNISETAVGRVTFDDTSYCDFRSGVQIVNNGTEIIVVRNTRTHQEYSVTPGSIVVDSTGPGAQVSAGTGNVQIRIDNDWPKR